MTQRGGRDEKGGSTTRCPNRGSSPTIFSCAPITRSRSGVLLRISTKTPLDEFAGWRSPRHIADSSSFISVADPQVRKNSAASPVFMSMLLRCRASG
ncbi:hypothetical protein [Patulibacter minatonensis]|uniref:hypothetical protein n=1 Tax=Patulibacter minatonensis TaxID=298163 RepID=UPI00068690A0|nr:hypothetical protein [Patulibacter minatonensis]